jgi:hypothetical protein
MKRLIGIAVGVVALLVLTPRIRAQDLLVPAGTLLQCTLNEPNLSSATAAVGDPVLCHLKTQQEFGRPLFPRGSMLAGHVEAEKEPGHFVGKGYLKLTFDRVILPAGDLPMPAKVISARGFKVDKQGDIDGKGHAKRDVVEWLIPPLWPWKIITLPLRGPRPTLKGEEPLGLRVMEDLVIPRNLTAFHPDRPPYAQQSRYTSAVPQPSAVRLAAQRPFAVIETNNSATEDAAAAPPEPANSAAPPAFIAQPTPVQLPARQSTEHFTMLVLKSNLAYEVVRYHRDGDVLVFQDSEGAEDSVDVKDVDWLRTAQMTATLRSAPALVASRQLN